MHSSPPHPPLAERVAIALGIAFAAAWALLWAQAVLASGTLDAYVRRPADLAPGVVGGMLVARGEGGRLYDLAAQHAAMQELLGPERALATGELLPYTHAPWEALALAPLVRFGPGAIYALWTLASLGALVAAVALLARVRPLGSRTALAVAAVASFFPIAQGLLLGQGSSFVLLGLCAAYAGSRLDRPGWIGLGVALTTLKPQITPFLVLALLFERQWRGLAWGAALLLVATALAAIPLGADWPLAYVDWLRQVAAWDDHRAIDPAIMTNWRGLAVAALGNGRAATTVTLAASVGTTLAFAALAEPLRRRDPDALWAATVVVALLAGLHAHPYEQTLLVLPGWLAFAFTERLGPRPLVAVAAVWVAAWPWDDAALAPVRAGLLLGALGLLAAYGAAPAPAPAVAR